VRNVILSVVVVAVLIGAGIGGTLADFSDIETSRDNLFETGSLDLKVSQKIGDTVTYYDDPDVPTLLNVTNAMPECTSKDIAFDLYNAGDSDQAGGWVYIHFKNLELLDTGKTEPEDAAEIATTPIGELDDGTFIYATDDGTSTGTPLLGADWGTGAGKELVKHVDVRIAISTTGPDSGFSDLDLSAYDDDPADDVIKLNELICEQILLSELGPGDTIWVEVYFRLQDVPESAVGANLFPAGSKFENWVTNALQDDQMMFDLSFELLQFKQ
jgi:predicted ribosomally synthesized peptide with SipW-like signal peptide